MKVIPGTHIPLCLVCEDAPATATSKGIGPICAECAVHASRAVVALAHAGLSRCTEPQTDNPS